MQEKPLILVTNDDGITAPGIRALIKIMNSLEKVLKIQMLVEKSTVSILNQERW